MPSHRPRKRWSRRRWFTWIGGATLAVALIVGWMALIAPRPHKGPPTHTVRVTKTDQTTSVSLSGVIHPKQQANVSFAVPGTLTAVKAKVGTPVTAGETLATVDDRDLRNAVALAEANLTAAKAQLRSARDAKSAAGQVAAVRAQVSSAQASLDRARSHRDEAALTAPISGIVATVNVEVGDHVPGGGSSGINASSLSGAGLGGMSGGSLPAGLEASGLGSAVSGMGGSGADSGAAASGAQFVIIVPDAWKLDATVGTADVASLKAGQSAVVTPKGTTTHVAGTVDSVGIVASSSSGQAATFPISIRINEPTSALFAGSSADAVVTTETIKDVVTVPANAVSYDGPQAQVRVPGGEAGRLVPVTAGRQFGDRTEIVSGVAVGDEVIVPKAVVVPGPPTSPFGPSPSPTPSR